MAQSLIRLEIVTPGGVVYSEDVEHAVIPTANGKIDILQHHAPLIDRLVPADVKVVDK
ncbi:MAG: ATP synthase F1 subunit epsilon, partial [Verrucomicrobiota bacterium]|nr:ATP synthase F1 subunit epsilon [Verrucomicrobiota bacterium]